MSKNSLRSIAAFAVFVASLASQTSYGLIVGSVTDPSGSIVPGAVVTPVSISTA